MSHGIPTLGILDVDGSLCENIFVKPEFKGKIDIIDNTLPRLAVYPWVVDSNILRSFDSIHVITGRMHHHLEITRRWLADNFGIANFTVNTINYERYTKYVTDKMELFDEIIKKWKNEHRDEYKVIFIEDDDGVIDAIRETYIDSSRYVIIQVIDGEPKYIC